MDLVHAVIPPVSLADKRASLHASADYLLSRGAGPCAAAPADSHAVELWSSQQAAICRCTHARTHPSGELLCKASAGTCGAAASTCCTGVTTLHDMGVFPLSEEASFGNLDQVYRHAADAGELRVRVLAMVPLTAWQATHDAPRARHAPVILPSLHAALHPRYMLSVRVAHNCAGLRLAQCSPCSSSWGERGGRLRTHPVPWRAGLPQQELAGLQELQRAHFHARSLTAAHRQ